MRWIVALLVAIAACGTQETGPTLDAVLKRGELIIGTEPEFPPFESRNAKGEYVGFDMDMIREFAKDLGVKLKIQPMAFDSLPAALGSRKIDLIISGMTATPKRAKTFAFSDSYFLTGLCLLVHKDAGIKTAADADGKRIVVKISTTGATVAREQFKNAKITTLDTEGACALEVVHHRVDAFLYDQLSILRHHQAHPDTTRALLKPLTKEPYAMAMRRDDPAFVARVNQFLKKIRADGRYDKIYKKHFADLPEGSG